jgi:hypothetical protein
MALLVSAPTNAQRSRHELNHFTKPEAVSIVSSDPSETSKRLQDGKLAFDHKQGAAASTISKSNNHVTFPVLRAATNCLQLHTDE